SPRWGWAGWGQIPGACAPWLLTTAALRLRGFEEMARSKGSGSGRIGGMKLQFSLATLLVCITVQAVVAAICAQIRVTDTSEIIRQLRLAPSGTRFTQFDVPIELVRRPPTIGEIALRLGFWGPVSAVATLSVVWIVRRLRRRTCPSPLR